MKIHFACLFGVDYDLDLLPAWSKYYLDMRLDSYKIFLHRENESVGENIKREFKALGFSIECIGGPQGNGILRKLVIGQYAGELPPEDFLVTADADEFQSMPQAVSGAQLPLPPNYRELLKYKDIVSGYMVDRYADRLEASFGNPFLQYPHEEPLTREILKNFTPPWLRATAWPLTRRTKILATRAGYDVGHDGAHCLFSVPTNARLAENFMVYHFAWRESAKYKALVKSYYTKENLNEMFGGNKITDPLQILRTDSILQPCGN
jgi:hypothetical protein